MKRNIAVYILISSILALSAWAQQSTGDRRTVATKQAQSALTESPISGTNAVMRIVAARDNAEAASEYEKPGTNKKLIAVQVIIDNRRSSEDLDVSGMYFKLKDEEGGVYDVSSSDSSDQPTLKTGSVDAADLVKGWITFEVSNAIKAGTLKLRYEFADNKSAWIQLSSLIK